MEDVNMNDPESIWQYYVHGLDLSPDDDFDVGLFVNSIKEISSDLNCFNKEKHLCAICGQRGHSFDGCPKLKNTNIEQAYIHLLLLANCFVRGFNCLHPNDHMEDLSKIQHLTLSELDVIDQVDISSLSQVSSSSPSTEERLQQILSLLEHSITSMLTQHHSVISNLSSLLAQGSASGGGADDDTGSTNEGSQVSINNVDALSSLQNFWKAGH